MSDPNIPSAEQLAETRRAHWHQDGNALLTAEAVLPWIERSGLVLFASRGQQFPAPAPTLVEATLGTANASPSVADRETARSLVQRLVAEGAVLPLNLLGAPGTTADEPDFVVSAAVFAYLFTLRGDKAWKQLPSAAGPFKVSPLAVNTYTLLSEGGPRSAYDLVTELGKGLTEGAVLRALSELWQHLRVFPVGQTDGSVVWELASVRFTKLIKSGANAGQPSALSALITLYLGQAVLATEDDVEVFLSPLAPRSRVRDVMHALTAAREVDTVVVEGKHYLHVRGDLPTFAPAAAEATATSAPEMLAIGGEGRIKKFAGAARRPVSGTLRSSSSERDRRPFTGKRDDIRSGAKPASRKRAFDRPWDEERTARDAHPRVSASEEGGTPEFRDVSLDAGSDAAKRPAKANFRSSGPSGRPAKPFGERRPGFGARDESKGGSRDRSGSKGGFSDRRGRKPGFGDRANLGSAGGPPFRPRRDGESGRGGDRPAYSRPREGAGSGVAGGDRPPFRPDRDGARPKRPFVKPGFESGPRPGASGDRRGPAKKYGPSAVDRPFRPRLEDGSDSRSPREFDGAKRFRADGQKRSSDAPASHGREVRSPRPERGSRTESGPAGSSPKRFGAGAGGPKRSFARRPASGGGSDRPTGKRPFAGKSGGGPIPGGPFEKFKGGNKPWGKRPPARKIRPEEDKA